MRKLLIIAYLLFTIGFILKLFHIHYNAILMLGSFAAIFIISIISLIKTKNQIRGIVNLSVSLWLLLIIICLKFFPIANIVIVVATLMSMIAIMILYVNKNLINLIPIVVVMAIALGIFLMPTNQRYYLTSIKWNYEIKTDYQSLDKYSWFLYQNYQFEEALDTSDKALKIANEIANQEWIDFIQTHNNSIREKNWKHFRNKKYGFTSCKSYSQIPFRNSSLYFRWLLGLFPK